jgi:hypothetical protein
MYSIHSGLGSNLNPSLNSNLDSNLVISSRGHRTITQAITRMARWSPEPAARAGASLDLILDGVYRSSWQEVAWKFSGLTYDGFPVEFAFSAADNTIRYVAEVSGPEVDSAERLDLAERKLASLGAARLPKEVSELLHKVLLSGPLQFGAWIGGRHGPKDDRYKLYVEVPRSDSDEHEYLIRDMLGDVSILPGRRPRFQMIGYEPATSRLELYFSITGLELWEIEHLLSLVGMRSKWTEFLSLIEEAYGNRPELALSRSRIGFSFSAQRSREEIVFTLFKSARSVFGSDRSIRSHILGLAELKGWDLRCYEALSLPVAEREGWDTRHGIISFVVHPKSQPALSITLRPLEDGA